MSASWSIKGSSFASTAFSPSVADTISGKKQKCDKQCKKTDLFLHAIKRSKLLLYFLVATLVARSDSKKHAGGTPSKRFKTMLSNNLFGTVLNALISLKT